MFSGAETAALMLIAFFVGGGLGGVGFACLAMAADARERQDAEARALFGHDGEPAP